MQKVSCNCGFTSVSVACGGEKKVKPPKCKMKCKQPATCHHEHVNTHNCHFGPCPGCKQVCGKINSCGHVCEATCHENVKVKLESNIKPAGPWELSKAQAQVVVRAEPCPPCSTLVSVTCLGEHESSAWPCHSSKPASCGRKCGRSLACGNHVCERECHKVRGAVDSVSAGVNCRKCEAECRNERPAGCHHPCSIGKCHPGQCPECEIIVRIKCHCALSHVFLKCSQYLNSDDQEKETLLCCKDQCPKLMPCGHRYKNYFYFLKSKIIFSDQMFEVVSFWVCAVF